MATASETETEREEHRPSPSLIVCGDNPLAYRLVEELVSRVGDEVTVILPSKRRNHGPRIAALPQVRLIEAPEPCEEAFRAAGIAHAAAVALVSRDDVGNFHAALRAQELNGDLRLVIRLVNVNLGRHIRSLLPNCEVFSDVDTAAPSFVAGAMGKLEPSHVPLGDRTLYVARRREVSPERVVCALADTSIPGQPELLPTEPDRANLVVAIADNPERSARPRRRRALLRRLWRRAVAVFSRKLALTFAVVIGLLGLGTALLTAVGHSVPDALYLTVLDAAGAAELDLGQSPAEKVTQAMITLVGISIIPLITLTVVDAVVSTRLGRRIRKPGRIRGHVVVVGLGDVGTRVLGQLHDLGVPVVCVESDEGARGVALARRIGVPVVSGDVNDEKVLRDARLHTARSLVAVTGNDVTNLEAGLGSRGLNRDLPLVLRLFDNDLALRVERTLGLAISRSVSHLAAPAFAAAMQGRQVLGTIPVSRRVLFIAEVPVQPGSQLDGQLSGVVHTSRQVRLLAIHATRTLGPPAPDDHRLSGGDRLVVLATRAGLTRVTIRSTPRRGAAGPAEARAAQD